MYVGMWLLTETVSCESGLYVLIVLTESSVVCMFWGRMADHMCKSSEKMKNVNMNTYMKYVQK